MLTNKRWENAYPDRQNPLKRESWCSGIRPLQCVGRLVPGYDSKGFGSGAAYAKDLEQVIELPVDVANLHTKGSGCS